MSKTTQALYECDNCGFTAPENEQNPVENPEQRFDEGGVYTSCECAICGSLAYKVTGDTGNGFTTPLTDVNDEKSLSAASAFVQSILNESLSVNLNKKPEKLEDITLKLAGYFNGKRQFDAAMSNPDREADILPLFALLSLQLDKEAAALTQGVIKSLWLSFNPQSGRVYLSSGVAKLGNSEISMEAVTDLPREVREEIRSSFIAKQVLAPELAVEQTSMFKNQSYALLRRMVTLETAHYALLHVMPDQMQKESVDREIEIRVSGDNCYHWLLEYTPE
ncbi:MAG: hypothetical protein GY774_07195 [Planctomycetes bacterium]|nr:hypothetical protein [Planctomycetota bacterium]|tara:strand:- start:420 stop:1253 length:834 start_codon:yes stop_codon:yes gene_type:complete